ALFQEGVQTVELVVLEHVEVEAEDGHHHRQAAHHQQVAGGNPGHHQHDAEHASEGDGGAEVRLDGDEEYGKGAHAQEHEQTFEVYLPVPALDLPGQGQDEGQHGEGGRLELEGPELEPPLR